MNRLSFLSSTSVSALTRAPDWRQLPVSARSTDRSQQLRASIAFSVEPAWYVQIRGEAMSGGQATVELNREKFQVTIAPKQAAGTTAEQLKAAFAARGYTVEVIGNEKPTPAELAALKAQLTKKEKLLRDGGLSGVALYRLQTEIEILKSQIGNQGFFDLVVHAPK